MVKSTLFSCIHLPRGSEENEQKLLAAILNRFILKVVNYDK